MLSALGPPDDRIHGLKKGADDSLSKPFAAKEHLLRINSPVGPGQCPAVQLDKCYEAHEIDEIFFHPVLTKLQNEGDLHSSAEGMQRFSPAPYHAAGLTLSRKQLARDNGSLVDVNNSLSLSLSLSMRISKLR